MRLCLCVCCSSDCLLFPKCLYICSNMAHYNLIMTPFLSVVHGYCFSTYWLFNVLELPKGIVHRMLKFHPFPTHHYVNRGHYLIHVTILEFQRRKPPSANTMEANVDRVLKCLKKKKNTRMMSSKGPEDVVVQFDSKQQH